MERETDNLYPNPPMNTPTQQPQEPSALARVMPMNWLPWSRKPIGKAKGKSGSPRTTRSGVHRLGMAHKKKY